LVKGSTPASTKLNNYFVLKGARLLPFLYTFVVVHFAPRILNRLQEIIHPIKSTIAFSVKRMSQVDNPFDTFINFSY